ncbi:hypothetical protein BC833DRAFT_57728 [Globomyces pollinis-pini]|nr:hypothetical protein BC833DRAFT_57728 [Globomyces pollinis-pini]
MKVSLVFFGFILNSVLACQSINTNSICNVYSNIQVDNAQDLESNVKSHSNLTSQLEKFKCPSLVTKLQTNKLTATLRYLRTFECQLHISNSTCKTETSNQQICYSSCMTFLMSLQAAFSNPDLCDQNPGWAINNQRSYFVNSISSICSASVTLKTCVPAIKLEAKNCGFGNDESGIKSANEWCKSQQGDPCCLSGIESINDDSGASPNGSTSTSTSNYLTIALVVGLICCLLIIAFAYFYFSRKSPKDKTKTKRISTSINPSNNEKSVPSTLQTPSMESLQMALSSTKPSTSNFGKQDSKASEDTRNSTASVRVFH